MKGTMMATGKREMFDAAEYVKRMDLMISKLRTKKPGEAVGKVGKSEILAMRRDALQQLVKDGYTVGQIAEAMKDDVFSILPKTITEIVGAKKTTMRAAARTKKAEPANNGSATVAATKTEQSKQPAQRVPGPNATFAIKPDTKDL